MSHKTSEERMLEAYRKYCVRVCGEFREVFLESDEFKGFKEAWQAQEIRVGRAVKYWYKAEIKAQELAANACKKAGLDPFNLRHVMMALQCGEATVSKAMECVRLWVAGSFDPDADIAPHNVTGGEIGEDEMPIEVIAKLREEVKSQKGTIDYTAKMLNNAIVTMQAAWIEFQQGGKGMGWIDGFLDGPDLIPGDEEPYSDNPQFWYDANRSDPFPKCWCGNPSHILWMGYGYCSKEHSEQHKKRLEELDGGEFKLESPG